MLGASTPVCCLLRANSHDYICTENMSLERIWALFAIWGEEREKVIRDWFTICPVSNSVHIYHTHFQILLWQLSDDAIIVGCVVNWCMVKPSYGHLIMCQSHPDCLSANSCILCQFHHMTWLHVMWFWPIMRYTAEVEVEGKTDFPIGYILHNCNIADGKWKR